MNGQWGALSWATHELPMIGYMATSNKLPHGAHMFAFHGPHERPLCVHLKTPTSKVIARFTPTRVQWILQVNCIHATQKSHETSQLWDQENGQETRVRICDKVIPTHMCLYSTLCIGILCGSHWLIHKNCPCKVTVLPQIVLILGSFSLTHETAHGKPSFCHTLALHGV